MLTKLKAIWATVWADICNTYQRIKIYLLGILAIIAFFEWQKIKAAFLVYTSKKEMASDKKEDGVFAQKEKTADQDADALTEKAKNEPNSGDDWYKS